MNYLLSSLVALSLVGCGPIHTVVDNQSMVIYYAGVREDLKLGKYEYHIRDNSTVGFKLITDQKFQVGDTLIITKKQQ